MKQACLLALLLYFLFSHPAFAFRCKHSVVELGDYKENVYTLCGTPESVERHIERRAAQNFSDGSQYFFNRGRKLPKSSINYGQSQYTEIEVLVEEWIYNFGRSKFRKYLRFENGKLTEIKNLGRGD